MKIILCGPIAQKGQPCKGGFQATNRKIIDKLNEMGISVIEMPFPVKNNHLGGIGGLVYLLLFFFPFKLLKFIFDKDCIFQISPVGQTLLYPATLIVWSAHFLNIPTVVHIMAGTYFVHYKERSSLYRFFARSIINKATAVAVESSTYIGQIREVMNYNRDIIYLPTTTNCNGLRPHHHNNDKYNLFYFGRLNKAKGVNLMIDLIYKLDDRFHLFLDGFLSEDIDKSKLDSSKVTYLGVESKEELKNTMKDMTFFIFPTRHKGEGQANSLIEAMAEGLIPVTSDNGFCSEVVGDCGIVLKKESTADDYKEAILSLCQCDLHELSARCQERIKREHNLSSVIHRLTDLYSSILKG